MKGINYEEIERIRERCHSCQYCPSLADIKSLLFEFDAAITEIGIQEGLVEGFTKLWQETSDKLREHGNSI